MRLPCHFIYVPVEHDLAMKSDLQLPWNKLREGSLQVQMYMLLLHIHALQKGVNSILTVYMYHC